MTMVIVGSSNARVGLPAGMEVLRRGGSALDAVEAAIRLVESNPDDHTVGLGGLPNILGVVELDASIMDGHTLAAGAVAAVRRCEHPISLARRVMEELPHTLLVGEGAERFARECGFPEVDLLTPEARAIYEEGLRSGRSRSGEPDKVLAAVAGRLAADPERAGGIAAALREPMVRGGEKDAGTVNVLALDRAGHMAVGVSTSGWAWKYPGRVGDSAVIGAGNYCDERWGAAACTGRGEMAIRCATAHSVVMYLRAGLDVVAAGTRAMQELDYLVDPYIGAMNCVVLDPRGRHAAFSTRPDTTYVFMDATSSDVEERPRHHVPVTGRSR
jgi:beta-aspartyl-peptidase (threonine type)